MNRPENRPGTLFWVSAAGGWAVIAYGLYGLFHHHLDTRPDNLATFVVVGALLHDLIVAPALLVIGVLIARATPGRLRAGVQAALIVSGCLVLFSYPLVRNYARVLHNPSSLPHNYAANLALVLATVWTVAAASTLFHIRRSRSG